MNTKFIRIFLSSGIAICILIFILSLFMKPNFLKKPNLVFISVDTLRADHMGIYGYQKETTPYIDSWAKNALIFDNARTVVPFTYGSFVSFFTGLHPLETKITKNYEGQTLNFLDTNTPTLFRILKQNGYTNSAFVTNIALYALLAKRKEDFNTLHTQFSFTHPPKNNESDNVSSKHLTQQAIIWIQQNKKKPFFLWLHILAPHTPYEPPNPYLCRFLTPEQCNQVRMEDGDNLANEELIYSQCQQKPMSSDTYNLYSNLYDGELRFTDKLVEQVLETLKKTKLDHDTIVVFFSDHGENMSPNYFGHGPLLYDSSIKIPLIIKVPGLKGSRNNMLIDNTDLMPTILKVLGIKTTYQSTFGKDFAFLFDQNPVSKLFSFRNKNYIISETANQNRFTLTTTNFKYTYNKQLSGCVPNEERETLFNISKTPKENNNLFDKIPSTTTSLKQILFSILRQYNIEITTTNKNKSIDEGDTKAIIEKLKSMGY